MNTLFLGREEVRAYLRDFLRRLAKFEKPPTVWCPVTRSGEAILGELRELAKDEFGAMAAVQVLPIQVNADRSAVRFIAGEPEDIRGKSVLLFDGAIHSGAMMEKCTQEVLSHGPAEVISYSLVVKYGSSFIPTLWGVMIAATDRAYFLLPEISNNRLDAGASRPAAPVYFERLNKRHLGLPPVVTKVDSMDRITWGDRLFQMQATDGDTCTYVLMRGAVAAGYLTIHGPEAGVLTVDEIAVDAQHHEHGYGGVLLRFAETLARQTDCWLVRLLGIEEKISLYEKFAYRKLSDRPPVLLNRETYWPMERAVLYHQAPAR